MRKMMVSIGRQSWLILPTIGYIAKTNCCKPRRNKERKNDADQM